jgi:hypothetical protein
MIETIPVVAVTALLHDRPTAIVRCPTRGAVLAGELRIGNSSVRGAHRELVLAPKCSGGRHDEIVAKHDSAGRATPLHLDNGRRRSVDEAGQLVGKICQVRHALMLAEREARGITRMGWLTVIF